MFIELTLHVLTYAPGLDFQNGSRFVDRICECDVDGLRMSTILKHFRLFSVIVYDR